MWFKKIFQKIKNFFWYWYQKRNEIKYLKIRDLKQANIITQIGLFTEKREQVFLNLEKINIFLHPIDRKSSLKKLEKRKKILKKQKKEILNIGEISIDKMDKFLPSITPIKVVEIEKDSFLVWEGNGRIKALVDVFKENKNIKIEVLNFKLTEFGLKIVKDFLNNLKNNEKE